MQSTNILAFKRDEMMMMIINEEELAQTRMLFDHAVFGSSLYHCL